MNTTFVIIALVLLVVWLFIRRGGSSAAKPAKSERRIVMADTSKSSEFHAVAIKFDSNACSAAKKLDGARLLSSEAPLIPLPGCDVQSCNCHFVHYNDRRKRSDRRSPFNSPGYDETTGKFKTERRETDERRHDDDEELL
jgi:hypothetical protein